MSKAEERALEAYPFIDGEMSKTQNANAGRMYARNIFKKGYKQAEKDLELTWQDIALIETISKEFIKNNTTPMTDQDYYQEVLKRFNEKKEETNIKELSIEEKARRYDEAIEKLRDFYRDYDTVSRLIDVKEELANLLPELKKSEGERIQKHSASVAEFDAEVESFCKECFITDSKEKDHVFTIARHFADWQKHRQKPTWSKKDEDIFNELIAYFISDMFLNHTEEASKIKCNHRTYKILKQKLKHYD